MSIRFTGRGKCSCGGTLHFEAYGESEFKEGLCDSCGERTLIIEELSASPLSGRLLSRATEELSKDETVIAVLLSAMAVEAFLSRLVRKWKGIELHLKGNGEPSPDAIDEATKEYSRRRGFQKLADYVSTMLVGQGFDLFAASPGFSKRCQRTVFDPRNHILHHGQVDITPIQAADCVSVARQTLQHLVRLDKRRADILDQDLEQQRRQP